MIIITIITGLIIIIITGAMMIIIIIIIIIITARSAASQFISPPPDHCTATPPSLPPPGSPLHTLLAACYRHTVYEHHYSDVTPYLLVLTPTKVDLPHTNKDFVPQKSQGVRLCGTECVRFNTGLCGSDSGYRHFVGTSCLHLHGTSIIFAHPVKSPGAEKRPTPLQ